jgi:hypothetical protein
MKIIEFESIYRICFGNHKLLIYFSKKTCLSTLKVFKFKVKDLSDVLSVHDVSAFRPILY